jgi:hypothetical protein
MDQSQQEATTMAAKGEVLVEVKVLPGFKEALKAKGLAWRRAEEAREQERIRQENERKQKEAEAAAADAAEAAKLAEAEPENAEARELADETRQEAAAAAVAPPAVAAPVPRQVRGAHGALGSRTVYRWELVDKAQVLEKAPELLTIDGAAVKGRIDSEKAAAKEQQRPFNLELIPGVAIVADEIGVSR